MTPEMKKAALRLHGLSDKDQRWILNALPSSTRTDIEALLIELEDLGIPRNQTWLNAKEDKQVENTVSAARDSQDLIGIVNEFNITQVKKVLDGIPDNMAIAILSIHHWKWKEQYLAKLKAKHRHHYSREAKRISDSLSDKVRENLLRSLINRVNPERLTQNGESAHVQAWQKSYGRLVKKWSSLWQH